MGHHLDRVTLSSVGTYDRVEHGRLERVEGYERAQLARHLVKVHGVDPFSLPPDMESLHALDATYHDPDDPREILRSIGKGMREFSARMNSNRIHDEVVSGRSARRKAQRAAQREAEQRQQRDQPLPKLI